MKEALATPAQQTSAPAAGAGGWRVMPTPYGIDFLDRRPAVVPFPGAVNAAVVPPAPAPASAPMARAPMHPQGVPSTAAPGTAASPAAEGTQPAPATVPVDPLDALATGDVALIDEELAEHQRWGAASARVGAAGSVTRAQFIAAQGDAGIAGGGAQAFATAAGMGVATRALEIAGSRAAIRLAGQAAGRAAPIPAIGAVIGGVMSAMDLAERDWGQTGQTIGRFGQGASDYEKLANSIGALSEILSVQTAVLNVMAGVIGAISIAMWAITVATVGVAAPLAATLSGIAAAIGIAAMILDALNALVLQPLVMTFRALHAFTSQADPTQVEEQGTEVRQAAAAGAGFVSGFAGGIAGGHAAGAAGKRLGVVPPHAAPVPRETPAPAAGDGPSIHADPVEGAVAHEAGAPAAEEYGMSDDGPAPAREAAPDLLLEVLPDMAPELLIEAVPDAAPASVPEVAPTVPRARPEQLAFGTDVTGPPRPVAPPNPHSAYLRALAAEGPGKPRQKASGRTNSIARHNLPDASNFRKTKRTSSPTPDLYQPAFRPGKRGRPSERQSHHPEMQSLLKVAIADYNPNEDLTALLKQQGHHERISAAQGPQYRAGAARKATTRTLGSAASLETAYNLLVWGTVDGPKPGAVPLMDPGAAGQLVIEHSTYLSETTRLSSDFGVSRNASTVPVRAGERLPSTRRSVAEVLAARGDPTTNYVEGYGTIDWDRTFSGERDNTQLSLALSEPAPRLRIDSGPDAATPDAAPRIRIDLSQADPVAPHAGLPEAMSLDAYHEALDAQDSTPAKAKKRLTLAMADPGAPGAAPRAPGRSRRPLTAAEGVEILQIAAEMGQPPERVVFHDGNTSVLNGVLRVGPDINPLPLAERPAGRANPANQGIEKRGVMAHEIIGHLEAAAAGQRQPTRSREEFQASTRAALHASGLPPDQFRGLMADATARLRHDADTGTFYIYAERLKATTPAERVSRPASHFRAQDRMPSVIINDPPPGAWQGAPPPPAAPAAAAPEGAPRPQQRLPAVIIDWQALGLATPAGQVTGSSSQGLAESAPVKAAPGGPAADSVAAPDAAGNGLYYGYAGTVAAGLWSAVPGVEQVHRTGRLASSWFGDARLAPPPGRRDALGNPVAYGDTERTVIGAGSAVGATLGGYVGQRVGEGIARRGANFVDGFQRGAREPIVERVNPAYPAPPEGGYDQVNALQERLARILGVRAQAEAVEQAARGDATHHGANTELLGAFDQRSTQAVGASEAHRAATERRQQANARRQELEGDVSAKLADASRRRSGLSMLTGPLTAFQSFSSLGELLPDGIPLYPEALIGPKRKIRQLNHDATAFLNALTGVDRTVQDQQAQTGPRRQEAGQHGTRLGITRSRAAAAQSSLGETSAQAQALVRRNQSRADESRLMAGEAATQGTRLEREAQGTRARIRSSAQRWQAWAQAHKQTRAHAIEQRRAALVARGYRIRAVHER